MAGDGDQSGLSRRDLLIKGGAATLGAWTAPLILESVLQPAFALTSIAGPPPAGTYRVQYDIDTGMVTPASCSTPPACAPTGWCTTANGDNTALGSTPSSSGNPNTAKIVITASNCNFTASGGSRSSCAPDGNSYPTKTVTFIGGGPGGSNNITHIYGIITCT